ncbi:hypothetical protein HQ520_08830 [bacterium]|nr:hypothetical protein [bacterium]
MRQKWVIPPFEIPSGTAGALLDPEAAKARFIRLWHSVSRPGGSLFEPPFRVLTQQIPGNPTILFSDIENRVLADLRRGLPRPTYPSPRREEPLSLSSALEEADDLILCSRNWITKANWSRDQGYRRAVEPYLTNLLNLAAVQAGLSDDVEKTDRYLAVLLKDWMNRFDDEIGWGGINPFSVSLGCPQRLFALMPEASLARADAMLESYLMTDDEIEQWRLAGLDEARRGLIATLEGAGPNGYQTGRTYLDLPAWAWQQASLPFLRPLAVKQAEHFLTALRKKDIPEILSTRDSLSGTMRGMQLRYASGKPLREPLWLIDQVPQLGGGRFMRLERPNHFIKGADEGFFRSFIASHGYPAVEINTKVHLLRLTVAYARFLKASKRPPESVAELVPAYLPPLYLRDSEEDVFWCEIYYPRNRAPGLLYQTSDSVPGSRLSQAESHFREKNAYRFLGSVEDLRPYIADNEWRELAPRDMPGGPVFCVLRTDLPILPDLLTGTGYNGAEEMMKSAANKPILTVSTYFPADPPDPIQYVEEITGIRVGGEGASQEAGRIGQSE